MFEVVVILLLLYLIWSTEFNFKVVVSNQKEIGKELELLKGAKNTERPRCTLPGQCAKGQGGKCFSENECDHKTIKA